MIVMKKLLVIILLPLVALIAQDYTNLLKLVEKYSQQKLLKHATWALYARYLDSGEEIVSKNAEVSVAPASGLKVFTTSAALNYLGEDFRFETKIYYDGSIDNNGVLNGNIYFVGGGDPTLGSDLVSDSLPLEELIERIISDITGKGIKSISGSVIADNSYYEEQPIPDHWEYIDIGNYYGAPSSALSIADNLYYLYFKPGKKVGDVAEVLRTEPKIPGLEFNNYMRTGAEGSGDNGYIYNSPYHYKADLRGTIPAGVEEFSIKGSIPDPPLFAAQILTSKLNENNIHVSGEPGKTNHSLTYFDSNLISVIYSPPLKDVVYTVNKRSNNIYTELLVKAIGKKVNGKGSTYSGIEAIEEFLSKNGINTDGLILHDGSGLSRSNAITAKMMVELLALNTQKKYYNSFLNSLAVVGDPNDPGYFSNMGRGTAIEKNARIKSGVINGVRSYSGYLNDRNGKTIVFSFIANNIDGPGSSVSVIHKELMIELAKLK